jgi:putative sterol carrier protein
MAEVSIQELFDRLPGAFIPEKAAGIDAVIQFTLSGDKGGDWWVAIRNNVCTVENGIAQLPTLVFAATAQDCLDIFTGKLDAVKAFMQGKIKLKGNFNLAMKLTGMFDVRKF